MVKNNFIEFLSFKKLFKNTAKIKKEKIKARLLRKTQWWKNIRAHNKCYYCENNFKAKELTMDHIVPLSKGGLSEKSNLVPCCKDCNNKKRNSLIFV